MEAEFFSQNCEAGVPCHPGPVVPSDGGGEGTLQLPLALSIWAQTAAMLLPEAGGSMTALTDSIDRIRLGPVPLTPWWLGQKWLRHVLRDTGEVEVSIDGSRGTDRGWTASQWPDSNSKWWGLGGRVERAQ